MFEGFEECKVATAEGEMFCRIKGDGPPLLLIHGHPQTHLMWYKTAPALSERFTVIAADIRGCGDSMACLLYTSPSPRDLWISRMPSSA